MNRYPTRQEDELCLAILDLRDHEGLSASQAGARVGKTKSAVLGLEHRIKLAELPCECVKGKNKDGGMTRKWWAAKTPLAHGAEKG